MGKVAVALAAILVLMPLGARAADLVAWWEKGFYPQEDAAVRETIAAFEQKTGKQVDLTFYEQAELPGKLEAALEAGQPPDFVYGGLIASNISQWAFEDRLVDLTEPVGSLASLFDPDELALWTLLNHKTGQRALYALPIGRAGNYIHVWSSLLQRAGFTLADIPKEWGAFWSFWCDQVQPAVRRATGRNDIWGVGLDMSGEASDTQTEFFQFMTAYDANYVSRDGRLVIDDPEVRRRLVEAMDA
jgi:multiple sugar transport system substrate-binding protein